ncbi:hypothetical protein ACU686_05675 [Yinghuangia aomiensis]
MLYQGTEARLMHHAVGSRRAAPPAGARHRRGAGRLRVLHRGEIALYQISYGAHAELRLDAQAPSTSCTCCTTAAAG